LILLVERPEGMAVILTRRPDSMRTHAGQVSLPGGGIEEEDENITAAALRETREEIGLDPELIEILGFLPPYRTRSTGFTVAPVVGYIRPPFDLTPNPAEVARIFEVPLDVIMDSDSYSLGEMDFGGQARQFYSLDYDDEKVWGLTARILMGLRAALSPPPAMPAFGPNF
jgi:hypothetical protein